MSRIGSFGSKLYRGEVSYNIVDNRRRWYALSAIILLAAVLGLAVRGLNLGIEFKGGAEYGYNDLFFLRGGFVGSSQDEFTYGASFGAGVKFHWGGSAVSLDYSWQQVDVNGFDDNQYFTVKFAF